MRCYLAIRNNEWLPRLKDTQETEDILQHQTQGLESQQS